MPHFIVEYTDNIAREADIPGLLARANRVLMDQGGVFAAQRSAGQVGQRLRVTFTGDECLDHLPGRHRAQGGGHRGHLDQGIFEQLLQPRPAAGPVPDQIHPHPGVVAQHPDRHGRHERRP